MRVRDPSPGDAVVGQDVTVFCHDVVRDEERSYNFFFIIRHFVPPF